MIYPRSVLQNRILLCIYNIADDAKVYSTITCDKDHLHLQKVRDHIKEWCDQWLLPLNNNKCSHMSYTSRLSIDTAYRTEQNRFYLPNELTNNKEKQKI